MQYFLCMILKDISVIADICQFLCACMLELFLLSNFTKFPTSIQLAPRYPALRYRWHLQVVINVFVVSHITSFLTFSYSQLVCSLILRQYHLIAKKGKEKACYFSALSNKQSCWSCFLWMMPDDILRHNKEHP